jgi:hypothetical protein
MGPENNSMVQNRLKIIRGNQELLKSRFQDNMLVTRHKIGLSVIAARTTEYQFLWDILLLSLNCHAILSVT